MKILLQPPVVEDILNMMVLQVLSFELDASCTDDAHFATTLLVLFDCDRDGRESCENSVSCGLAYSNTLRSGSLTWLRWFALFVIVCLM